MPHAPAFAQQAIWRADMIPSRACGAVVGARSAALAMALTLAGAPWPVPAQDGCGARYVVQPGDTLAGIAERCGTTVEALAQANAVIVDPALIAVGWELTVPGARASLGPQAEVRPRARGAAAEAALTQGTYQVRPGDSLASIATALQLPMQALMAANEGVDPFGIRPGQTLNVPPDAAAADRSGDKQADGPADAGPAPVPSGRREARSGARSAPVTQAAAAEPLMLEGRVQSGAECPVLTTPDGETYSLVSAEYAFVPGDYVAIEGEPVEMSFCMQESATVRVTSMTAIPAPQGG
jgi:LysM repeat protein